MTTRPLTTAELLDAILSKQQNTPEKLADSANRAEAERIELEGRRQFFELRKRWSLWLIIWISVLLAFQILLAGLIGMGILNFRDYDWFLPLVAFQNFLQICGMGYIIVRFLYPPTSAQVTSPDQPG